SSATWRQVGYHVVAGPCAAAGAVLALLCWAAGASVVAGIAVIAAAFFLERVCKLPDGRDDENQGHGTAHA
ncbi:hypothetical protein ACFC7A_12530, partial [Streptomyces niveus]